MRQFGCRQFIPPQSIACSDENHAKDRKSKVDWSVHLYRYLQMWFNRFQNIVDGGESSDSGIASTEYYGWYSMIPHKLIQPMIDEVVDDAVVMEDAAEVDVNPPEQIRRTQPYRPDEHFIPKNVSTLVYCAQKAAEGFHFFLEDHSRQCFHAIFHHAYETLESIGEVGVLGQHAVADEDDYGNPNIELH